MRFESYFAGRRKRVTSYLLHQATLYSCSPSAQLVDTQSHVCLLPFGALYASPCLFLLPFWAHWSLVFHGLRTLAQHIMQLCIFACSQTSFLVRFIGAPGHLLAAVCAGLALPHLVFLVGFLALVLSVLHHGRNLNRPCLQVHFTRCRKQA